MKKTILFCTMALLFFLTVPMHSAEARHTGDEAHSPDLAAMHQHLNKKAALFRSINKKASRNLANAARVRIFNDYFSTKSPVEKGRLKKKILKLTRSAQRGFKVDEICLISTAGHEITSIVFNKIVPESKLSSDEKNTPFFRPTLKKGHGEVHIQDPYLSSDSNRWVIAYTTPIVTADGSKPAFLHYEIPLSFFAKKMAKGTKGDGEYVLIVGNDGLLWADSRSERDINKGSAPRFDDGRSPKIKKILKTMRKGESGSDNFTKKGVKYAIVYKPLGYFDWNIAVVNRE